MAYITNKKHNNFVWCFTFHDQYSIQYTKNVISNMPCMYSHFYTHVLLVLETLSFVEVSAMEQVLLQGMLTTHTSLAIFTGNEGSSDA